MLRLALAWLHLLALGVGLGAVWGRGRALRAAVRESLNRGAIGRALTADTWWGVAAGLSLVTGLWRLFASTEKTTSYYLANHIFLAKMGLFVFLFVLDLWPMVTLIKWRSGKKQPTARVARRIETISYLETVVVIAIVLAAVAMARGYG